MITETFLDLLVCPKCKSYLHLATQSTSKGEIQDRSLECTACRVVYPIKNGIPNLIVEIQNDNLQLWEKAQQNFIAWNQKTWDGSPRAKRLAKSGRKCLRKFVEFGQPSGRVLDVGCGGGSILQFIPPNCDYYGIDPIPHEEVRFPFVQAIGEYLPFRDESFDTVIINATLDHVLEPTSVLNEIQRCLSINGHILVANTISGHRTILQTILMFSRQGLKKIWLRDIPGLIRGIRIGLGLMEHESHLHHYTRVGLVELIGKYFGNVHSSLVDGNLLFVKGEKVTS